MPKAIRFLKNNRLCSYLKLDNLKFNLASYMICEKWFINTISKLRFASDRYTKGGIAGRIKMIVLICNSSLMLRLTD